MKYQISRHIEAQFDTLDTDKVLLENLYHHTRMLCGDEIWQVLQKYETPCELGADQLDTRAAQAKIIEPVDQSEPHRELRDRFDEISAKVLKYRKVEASEDLDERLTQLRNTCKPVSSQKPIEYFIWHNPNLVFRVMIDHFRVYLNTEFAAAQTSSVKTDFLRRSLGRPTRQESLEQQVCTLDTAWRRAARIGRNTTPESRVLVVGDDDLVSIALSCFPLNQIDVLEFDSLLVRLLKRQGGEKLKVYRRDLNHGIPEDYEGQFDVVLSDPMYATDGMSMFLGCCAKALKPGGESRLYLTTYPPLLEDPDGFLNLVGQNGLTVHETVENFSRYPFPKDMRDGAREGLDALGYHPKLSRVLLDVPYLYAHLYVCGLKADDE